MAIWRDEVETAVNASVRNNATIDAWLSVHVLFIAQVDVVNEWFPATTTLTASSLTAASFIHVTAGREYSMLSSVTTQSSYIKFVMMPVAVSKVGVVLYQAWSKKSIDSTYLLTYLSTSLRIGPFHLQAGGCKRRPDFSFLFCVVVYFVQTRLLLLWLISFQH